MVGIAGNQSDKQHVMSSWCGLNIIMESILQPSAGIFPGNPPPTMFVKLLCVVLCYKLFYLNGFSQIVGMCHWLAGYNR